MHRTGMFATTPHRMAGAGLPAAARLGLKGMFLSLNLPCRHTSRRSPGEPRNVSFIAVPCRMRREAARRQTRLKARPKHRRLHNLLKKRQMGLQTKVHRPRMHRSRRRPTSRKIRKRCDRMPQHVVKIWLEIYRARYRYAPVSNAIGF